MIRFLYILLILGLIYYGIKFLLPLLMPFVIGMIIATIFRRPIDFIQKKTGMKRAAVSILVLIGFYGLIIFLTGLLGAHLFSFIRDLFSGLPKLYIETIQPALNNAASELLIQFPILEEFVNNINDSIFTFLTTASSTVVGAITGFAGQLPTFLIRLLFTIISSFFFTIDFHRIMNFIMMQFSEQKQSMLIKLKDNGIGTLGKFFRAYATIICITFIELSIGFLILRVPNAILIAALVAIVDVFPILGTGSVLMPWAFIAFIMGNHTFAIGMVVLYGIITVIRQAIEPRIVGQQIGLHPVVTLLCMFVGAQLFGVLGLLLLPIIATIIKKLNDDGTIKIFKY